MFCHNCGNEMEEGAVFCSHCGTSLQDAGQNAVQAGPAMAGQNAIQAAAVAGQNAVQASAVAGQRQTAPDARRKGKGGVIAVALAVLALAAGTAGGVFYFTSDGYICGKNMKLAKECFGEERYEEALAYCRAALERDSARADAYLMYADILLSGEEYGEAVRILEKGLKKTRDDEDAQELLEAKMDEVNQAQTAAVSGRLREYLDQELAPRYGYAELGPQTKEVNMDTVYDAGVYEADKNWTGTEGIAFSRIYDWDQDGRDELLAISLEDADMALRVYEVEDQAVVQKAEYRRERIDDMTGCDEIWFLAEVENGTYLNCVQDYWSILGDGTYEAVTLYRYDGENLYTPLVIEKGWGSAEYVYRAYQYDGNGNRLSEEILYDEAESYGNGYDREYFEGRMAELFAGYGIETVPGEGILTAANHGEVFLAFSMWGDYRNYRPEENSWCDTVIYHFNDWDSPLLAYGRFLRGEQTLRMRDGAWYLGDRHQDWTFQDILAELEKEYLEYADHGVSRVEYAFMDCGEDGVEEMQLRFVGLDIYSPGDDSDLTMVISNRDGQLEMIYSCESWARSDTQIDYYGCIYSSGSAGAGDHLFDMGYMDGNGDFQVVFEGEDLGGWWISGLSGTAYNTAFSGYGGSDPRMSVTCYTIGGEDYYTWYADEDLPEYREFVSLCELEGKQFVMDAEIEILIGRRMRELGIKESWETGKGLYWNGWYY